MGKRREKGQGKVGNRGMESVRSRGEGKGGGKGLHGRGRGRWWLKWLYGREGGSSREMEMNGASLDS